MNKLKPAMDQIKPACFAGTRGKRTALVVWADNPGGYFFVRINHEGGAAERTHNVEFVFGLRDALQLAESFLEARP